MMDVTCECRPVFLQRGDQVWTFDVETNQLHVRNNSPQPENSILASGTYPIAVGSQSVTIETVEYDYYFTNGRLFLSDHPEVDGPLIEFEKD
ncbi:MAG: hypothetical protein ACFB10_06275 [Salibacteraceae bacterium]